MNMHRRKPTEMGMSGRGWSNVSDIMPKINAAVKDKAQNVGGEKVDLSTSENWLLRPELVEMCKEAIAQKLEPKHLSYPQGLSGPPELLQALANMFNAHFAPRIPVEPAHIVTAPGAAGCIDAILYNICNPGDGVLLPGPYWSGFDLSVRVRTAVNPVLVPVPDMRSNFTAALVPALERALLASPHRVRALLLCNPHNPLAVCYPRDILEACVRFCARHGLHLVCDEVYALTRFENPEVAEPVPFTSALALDVEALGGDRARVHTIWSASKDLGQSGFRMGCVVTQANRELAIALALETYPQLSTLTSLVVTHILSSPRLPALLALNSERLGQSYRLLTACLARHGIPYMPCNAGLFLFARLAPRAWTWRDEAEIVGRLKRAGVVVSSGRSYHDAESEVGWCRIAFAVEPSALEAAVARMDFVFGKRNKVAGLREIDIGDAERHRPEDLTIQ